MLLLQWSDEVVYCLDLPAMSRVPQAVMEGPPRLVLRRTRRYVALVGEFIDHIATLYTSPPWPSLSGCADACEPLHVTVISKQELQLLRNLGSEFMTVDVNPDDVVPVGLGRAKVDENVVYFIPIIWEAGQRLRACHGLPRKDFHVTLATSMGDVHTVDKGFASLLHDQPAPPLTTARQLLAHAKSTIQDNAEVMNLLTFLSRHSSVYPHDLQVAMANLLVLGGIHWKLECQSHSLALMDLDPLKGYVRLGDCLLANKMYTMAGLAYLEAWCRQPSTPVAKYIGSKLKACIARRGQFWCSLVPPAELPALASLASYLPPRDMNQVDQVFSLVRDWQVPEAISVDPREHLFHRGLGRDLPRFFSWLVHGLVAGMSEPRHVEDIEALEVLGIGSVVTLTEERPLPESWFQGRSLKHYHIPVENYKAPSSPDVVDFVSQLILQAATCSHHKESVSDAVLIHCGGGKGRAGTFLACYLMRHGLGYPGPLCPSCLAKARMKDLLKRCDASGCPMSLPPAMSAQVAIALLRTLRPGSVETVDQEQFLQRYSELLWRRYEEEDSLVVDQGPLRIQGTVPECPALVVCCGLPGSGKSWFARELEDLGYHRVCQDEMDSRTQCEEAVTAAIRQARMVVVDRCNPRVQDRELWLELAGWPKASVCVYFSADGATCAARAKGRLLHPTLRPSMTQGPGRIERAIKSFDVMFETPTRKEKFQALCQVPSHAACQELLELIGVNMTKGQHTEPSTSSGGPAGCCPHANLSHPGSCEEVRFYKFPRTRHLMNLGAASRDDLLMSDGDCRAFLRSPLTLTLEEKVDGANIGLSMDVQYKFRVQNRGKYITSVSHTQFKALDKWLQEKASELYLILAPGGTLEPGRYVLFGEWLAATHTIPYSRLPDRFLAFDIYDAKEGRFFSRGRFRACLSSTSIHMVPRIEREQPITEDDVRQLMGGTSQYYDGPVEGIYFRLDDGDWLHSRAEVVRTDFIVGGEFWSKGGVKWNGMISGDGGG